MKVNTMTATWEAPTESSPTGYNVWVNHELVAENTTELSQTFNTVDGNYYIVEVQTVYGEEKNAVKIAKGVFVVNSVVVAESANMNCRVYPNPVKDQINIVADGIQMVYVYNLLGAMVDAIKGASNNYLAMIF
jgi:hypothetical protein